MKSASSASKLLSHVFSAGLLAWLAACGGGDSEPAAPPAAPAAAPAPAAVAPAPAAAPAAPAQAASPIAEDSPDSAPASADSGLAADVPVYPGAVMAEVAAEGAGKSAIFTTPDASDRVADRYFADLRENDWVVQQSRAEDGQALFAEKGSRSLAVMVQDRGDQGSEISVMEFDTSVTEPDAAGSPPPVE